MTWVPSDVEKRDLADLEKARAEERRVAVLRLKRAAREAIEMLERMEGR